MKWHEFLLYHLFLYILSYYFDAQVLKIFQFYHYFVLSIILEQVFYQVVYNNLHLYTWFMQFSKQAIVWMKCIV